MAMSGSCYVYAMNDLVSYAQRRESSFQTYDADQREGRVGPFSLAIADLSPSLLKAYGSTATFEEFLN